MNELQKKQNDGKLDAYTWPGGYPIFYLVADGGILCPDCANGKDSWRDRETLDENCPDDDAWRVIAEDIHWEGLPLTCDHCNKQIESAYGNPPEEE